MAKKEGEEETRTVKEIKKLWEGRDQARTGTDKLTNQLTLNCHEDIYK